MKLIVDSPRGKILLADGFTKVYNGNEIEISDEEGKQLIALGYCKLIGEKLDNSGKDEVAKPKRRGRPPKTRTFP